MRPFRLARIALVLTLILVLPPAVSAVVAQEGDAQKAAPEAAEKATVEEEVAVLKTNQGDIVLRFFPDLAPNHVANFKTMAGNGVYDGTKFHRVIPGFMIQGGDPNTGDEDRANDGIGGAGPGVKAEFSPVPHRRGILSMARKPNPDSATSQFFIMVSANSGLDNKYSVFGQVVSGMDAVDKIVSLPRDRRDNPLPDNPAIIDKVVLEKQQIPPRAAWTKK